ncbi:dephospho-CoA kinase [Terracoccus luteus]|uniref:Dephospho-CoA kinase n=1 Tax=Terracoccus luteus TaxID=53356 RepID=A0A839PWS0_9MICO|nr:dephospho-CoA kinase [Terracoccus luteus]MBB2987769.1 dephospho-CoA kinase [Terracoccus luteus]MCP2173420.1 dephospho-CoA kinase [Terracoccus luteus]
MLRVGVTGGIGSGKSTVSRRLAELGAVVVDADLVAREVMEPGEPTLDAVASRFGPEVLRPDGTLDRAGLASIVFRDPSALADLDAITVPAIAQRVAARRRDVARDSVSVYDMPLLVERGAWVHEHLTVVVEADVETRVQRLVDQRGLGEGDARRRMAAQATDEQRRAVADVVLPNDGSPDALAGLVDGLWRDRLAPWNDNLLAGRRSRRPDHGAVVPPDPLWEARGSRVVAKLAAALSGQRTVTEVSHIGSTAVPGLPAKDVIDVQVGVRDLADADAATFHAALRDAGYVCTPDNLADRAKPGSGETVWAKRYWGGCDPGEVVHVHVRQRGSQGWRFALLFPDWLRHVPAERAAYAAEKQRLLALDDRTGVYAEAKEPWFDDAWVRAGEWASRTGWHP